MTDNENTESIAVHLTIRFDFFTFFDFYPLIMTLEKMPFLSFLL